MAKWNIFTKATNNEGRATYLGQVTTEIPDAGRAQEIAERHLGPSVTVVRESHIEIGTDGHPIKKDD